MRFNEPRLVWTSLSITHKSTRRKGILRERRENKGSA
jgi:hypothetical protein